jgi:hypothetical protein
MFLLSFFAWIILFLFAVKNPIRGVPKHLCGGCFGGNDSTQTSTSENTIKYTPEATAAQTTWSDWLNQALSSGDYGASDMNWDEIFNTAQSKLSRYYWGGVNDTGLAGKVKASAARRGVSQSPALETNLASLGMQESLDLNDLMTNLTTQKASYTNSAKNTWLQSLMNLAGLSSGSTTTGTTTTSSEDDSLSSILGTLTSAGLGLATGGTSGLLTGLLGSLATSQSSLI